MSIRILLAILPLTFFAETHRLFGQTTAPATTQSTGAEIKVYSARFGRNMAELRNQFHNGINYDANPGVNIQFGLKLSTGSMLPLSRDAIAIETFIDDTYQDLLSFARPGSSPVASQVNLSDDGKLALFSIQTTRGPAEEASRIFVRGKVNCSMVIGELGTAVAPLTLKVGATAKVGAFNSTIRSIAENGRGNISVTIAVEGEASRIRKIRALSKDGRIIQDQVPSRFDDESGRPSTFFLSLPAATDEILLEYQSASRIDSVTIPFESQIDFGGTKSGPPEPTPSRRSARQNIEPQSQAWPPPPRPVSARPDSQLPAPRPSFQPASGATGQIRAEGGPTTLPKLEKTAVDLFAISVGKAPPGEGEGTKWENPPATSFRAAAVTTAKLLVSTHDRYILSIPGDAVTIDRFEDNKAGPIKFSTLPAMINGFSRVPTNATTGADAHQALVTTTISGTPRAGATKITIAGSMRAKVTKSIATSMAENIPVMAGQQFTAGPFTGTFSAVYQQASFGEGAPTQANISVNLTGPVQQLAAFELINPQGKEVIASQTWVNQLEQANGNTIAFTTTIRTSLPDTAAVRLRYNEGIEDVSIPFEIVTGIGL